MSVLKTKTPSRFVISCIETVVVTVVVVVVVLDWNVRRGILEQDSELLSGYVRGWGCDSSQHKA
jgi:hypothetical protein